MRVFRSRDARPEAREPGVAPMSRPGTAKTVVLHVGAPKTGSTFLQQVLWNNRDVLGDAGVGYLLDEPGEHFAVTMDLREMEWGGTRDPAWDGAWDRIAKRIRDWSGHTAVFSNELLGGATVAQVCRAVESLQPADVRVVFTARDLARQLSSDWQEQVKHTHTVTFDAFVDDLVAHGINAAPPFGPMFWGLHDPVHVLRAWSEVLGAANVAVVTVPQRGAPRELLWQRFAAHIGFDPQLCELDSARANPSLGAAEAELLRTINERADRKQPRHYDDPVRARLIDDGLALRAGRAPIAFPERHYEWVRTRSRELIEGVRHAGYVVVGDLAELEPVIPVPGAVDPAHVDQATMLDAALDALAAAVTH